MRRVNKIIMLCFPYLNLIYFSISHVLKELKYTINETKYYNLADQLHKSPLYQSRLIRYLDHDKL